MCLVLRKRKAERTAEQRSQNTLSLYLATAVGPKRMQPRVFGHKAGMESLQKVTIAAKKWVFRVWLSMPFQRKIGLGRKRKFLSESAKNFYDRYVPELHTRTM